MLTHLKFLVLVCILFLACNKKDIVRLPVIPDQSFTEEFDTVSSAFQRGWVAINNSLAKGSDTWSQGGGNPALFNAYSPWGSISGFIGTTYLSTSEEAGIISNWLVSPKIWLQNGDKISFYTRSQLVPNINVTGDSTDYGNDLSVHLNTKNDSTYIGIAADPSLPFYDSVGDRGDFVCVFKINKAYFDLFSASWQYAWAHTLSSQYEPGAYPAQWTRFEVIISGLTKPVKGRFAFRYHVLSGGSNGNATGIGIDKVMYHSAH